MRLALLAAAVLAASNAPVPAPDLRITASRAAVKQGGVVAITVTSESPLPELVLSDGGTRIPLERAEDGKSFRGLVGVDLAVAKGERPLTVEAPGGAPRLAWTLIVTDGRFRVQRLSVDSRYVEVPKEEQERIKADQARVEEAYRRGSDVRLWTSFARPVRAPSQGNFGVRRVYNGKTRSHHAGLDLAAPEGTPIAAAADGRVVLAGDLYFSGGTVLLDHGAGLFTQYFHLSRIDVKEGDAVRKGGVLGASGHTGRVTGPHLHWGAKLRSSRVNPEDLLALPAWPLPGAEER